MSVSLEAAMGTFTVGSEGFGWHSVDSISNGLSCLSNKASRGPYDSPPLFTSCSAALFLPFKLAIERNFAMSIYLKF